jgi:hypothetical protein
MRFIAVVGTNEAGKDGGIDANAARLLRHAACVFSSGSRLSRFVRRSAKNKRWRNFFSGNTLVS